MEKWKRDARHEAVVVDIDALVPKDHLLRKIEKVMDYEWLYERLEPYYNHKGGRLLPPFFNLLRSNVTEHIYNDKDIFGAK